jgi:putative transcriptional regulator
MADRDSEHSLAPTLLVSMPQLLDPNFARAVVLLCEHGQGGAFGLVINRPTDTSAAQAVQLTPPAARDAGVLLWQGGPVEPQRGWILLAERPEGAESVEISKGLFLTTSLDVLRAIVEEGWPKSRILTGYAGWGPGQLDEELAESAWLTAEIDPRLVFDTPAQSMWEAAIRQLGADPGLLQMGHGVH